MKSLFKLLAIILLAGPLTLLCQGATIEGSVRVPDGSPLQGAFVQARNLGVKMTIMALSDDVGHYQLEDLPPGNYRLEIKATGFVSDPSDGVTLSAQQKLTRDFSLRPGTVRWSELSIYQADKLLPPSKAKTTLFQDCFVCHGFQSRMAAVTRDKEGWEDRIGYMREAMKFSLGSRFSDEDAAAVASYLTAQFGPESTLPKSPTALPEYKGTIRPFSRDAMNIVYVEYQMPPASRFPFSAAPDNAGFVWIPNFGVANAISRLDPKTGDVKTFPVPNVGTAAVHSALAAPDGSVWLAEQGSNKLGRWDPKTQKITEFQAPTNLNTSGGPPGTRHTLRFDLAGNVWSGSYPLNRFDPESGKFTDIKGVPEVYSLVRDRNGDMWFTAPFASKIGRVNWKTLESTMWSSPTPNSYPRRIDIDAKGIIWFGEYTAGKIGSFDPATRSFKEYSLPGPQATPYAIAVDTDQQIWYSSYNQDVIGRLDPRTGSVTEYPFPHAENTIREFFRDSKGRIWYGSPANDRVGYFYLARGTRQSIY